MAILSMLNAPQPAHTPRTAPQRASRGVPRLHAPSSNPRADSRNLDWAALRRCESGGNYANKRNPTFRGAYQFSHSTWRSVGGTGDPADASPDEQDQRAAALYGRSGRQPWPICGRLL